MPVQIFILILLCSSLSQASWKASGSVESYFKQYSFPSTSEYSAQSGGLNAELKADWKSEQNWRFRSLLEVRADFLSKDSSEKVQGNPKQFYLENKATPVVVRAGYQTLTIDGPDLLNPADVVHQRNYTDPTNPTVLSSPGISLLQEWEEWQWELFFIPVQTKPVLPGARSAWWPREKRLPIESAGAEFRIPSETAYQFADSIELNNALKNNIAFKLQRKSESFEAQIVLFDGLSKDPQLNVIMNGTFDPVDPDVINLDSPVTLLPVYFRQQVAAGTFLIPFSSWVLRGGANYAKPVGTDSRIPEGSATYVLGLEKSFETRKGLITAILQHELQKRKAENQISFLRSIFENAWTLGLRVPWGEETSFLGGVIYDTVGKSSVYRLTASRRLTDSWSGELEGQILQGPDNTLLGLYNRYDRWGLKLIYHW